MFTNIKLKLLNVVLSVTLFSLHFGIAQNMPGVKWIAKNPFEQKVFIENKGQYELPGKDASKNILYYSRQNGLQYYFTPTGISISRIVSVRRPEEEIEQLKLRNSGKKVEEDDDDELEFKNVEQFHEMNFVGAGSRVTITGEDGVSWYYGYTVKGGATLQAHAWKRLTYHNLYPGIDVELYFRDDKKGLEYSFVVKAGADISQIMIQYNGVVTLDPNGKMTITSPYGDFTEYAPVASFLSSNEEIKCGFSLTNEGVKFTASTRDNSDTLLIDPLIIPPTFNGTNSAYDLDWDDAGNIYVYGGSFPWQILKYNSVGTLLWSYTTTFNGNNQYLGDFAVDRHSQSVYVTEGRDASLTGAIALKLNGAGVQIAQYGGNTDFNEMWKIAFSSCTNQAVIAGGGSTTPSYTASYLDTNLVNLQLVNTLNDTVSGYHDMWDLALDNFGNSYMVTAHSAYSTLDPDSFNNILMKLPLPTLIPTSWMSHSKYDVLEHGSLTYGLNDTRPPSPGNGYNGMTVSNTTLYTYDSYVLKQWGTAAGNILDSIFVNGPSEDYSISWGGLTSDDCGNIFLGSINAVRQYNSNLNLVQTFAQPDTVYDVRLSNTDMLYVCGIDFISATQLNLPSCYIIKATNDVKNVDCDTLGSATVTPSGGTPPYAITWNTVPVQTGNTATRLYPGTYIATIYDSSCTVQTYFDTIKILTNAIQLTPNNATICEGNSAVLSASGAASTYNWSPSTGLSSTSGSSVVASPTITTTYTVIGTSAAGCSDTVQSVVTVNPTPLIVVTNPPAICLGSSTTLTVSGAKTYRWMPATGLSDTTGSSITADPSTSTTYTITGTDSIGCTGTTTVAVIVNPNPTITVATPAPICSGSSTTLTANGAKTYMWAPATGLNATSGSSVTANPVTATTYTIMGTDGNGCTGTATITVAVNPNPIITVVTPSPICSGSSTTLTASGATSYSWTPSIGLSDTTGSFVTANPTTTTTYVVTGTNGNGCTNTTTIVVTVTPNLIITVSTPPPICSGSSATLTVNGAANYTWSPSTGLSDTAGSSVTATPTITSTYTIIGTSGAGCSDTTAITVTVNPNPSITVTTPAPICSGSNTTITANGGLTYSWTPSTGLSDTSGSSVAASPTINTTYSITGTTGPGCIGTTTVNVIVNSNPVIKVATPAPICAGSSTALMVNGATSYSWTPATSLNTTSGSSVIANPTMSSTYSVTGINIDGCTATTIVPVMVNPNPSVTVATPAPICKGSNTILTAKGASTYLWTPVIGLNNSTGSSVTVYSTVTTTYTITGTDSNNCVAKTVAVVTVNPDPVITASTPPPMCSDNSAILTASGATTYIWTPSAGLNNSTGSAVTTNPSATTTYTVIGTDGNGCNSTAEINVIIYPLPKITVSIPPAFCKGDSVTLIARGATTYSWSPLIGLSASTGSTILSKPGNTVTYTVTGINGNGCIGTDEVTVIVNPNPTVSVNTPPGICRGNSQKMIASGAINYSWSPSTGLNVTSGSSVIANPTSSTTYTIIGTNDAGCASEAKVQFLVMSLPNVSIFGLNSAYCINSSSVALIGKPKGGTFYGSGVDSNQFNPSSAGGVGTYLIKYIYTDSNGCEDSSSTVIAIDPLPKVIISPNNPTVCSGIPVTLNVMGADYYIWRPGAGLSDSTSNNITADPTVTTTYVVTGINGDSCFDTAMVTVYVDSTPTASFNTQISNYCEPLTMQFNNTSDDGVYYSWDFGDGATSNESNPQHTYRQGGVYQVILTAISKYGCINDTVKDIVISQSFDDLVQIGNAFTPGVDGINGIITPHVLCTELSGYVFRVYNRWGQLLFQTYDPNIGWDGKFNGQMQLVGVYDYYIEFNCGNCKIFKKGNITLLK